MELSFNMYLTAAVGLLALLLGKALRKKIKALEYFCIPAPVIGGIIFAVVNLILHETGILDISFDETLKDICMMIFFTTVGFQANIASLKAGGKGIIIFVVVVSLLIVLQNAAGAGVAALMGQSPLLGMCTGSVPMVGGHGTSAAFGPIIEKMGFSGATTFATAAATFGLIMGSLIGGPAAKMLIRKNNLREENSEVEKKTEISEDNSVLKVPLYTKAVFQVVFAMGVGSIISELIAKMGIVFPSYIGAMVVAAMIRNIGEKSEKLRTPMNEIESIGNISLNLFLGMAMITLKLWQLAELALPLIILLLVQTILMIVFSLFVVFPVMGKDYDAAVIVAGTCGFGMGATPNALANMQSVTDRYGYSEKPYLIVPIVGALFVDFINSAIITFFLNLL